MQRNTVWNWGAGPVVCGGTEWVRPLSSSRQQCGQHVGGTVGPQAFSHWDVTTLASHEIFILVLS